MKQALTLSVVVAVAAITAHAGIIWGPITETSTTLSGSATWTGSPDPEMASIATPLGDWWLALTFGSTAKSYSVVLDGQHLVAPHAGDTAPGDIIELGVLFTKATGSGSADGTILHNPGARTGHTDTWHLDASGLGTDPVTVQFTAEHLGVPEPGTYAMISGVGLIGFAAFRRRKA